MNFLFDRKPLLFLVIAALFCMLYFPLFTADFAYLDEIHQLWNNRDDSNLNMFLTQGRWLTGLLFQKFFASISTIEQLKLLRLFSLVGWVLTSFLLSILFRKWAIHLQWQPQTLWLATLYLACSLSVCIFVGWASCMEVFAGVAAGVGSGHILYTALVKQKGHIHLSNLTILFSLSLGVVSLFIYQTAFGAFLLPFFFHYVKKETPGTGRTLIIGVAFYLLTYIVYYFLFQYSLKAYGVVASDRTGVSLDVLRKIGFFFSGPLPQAFSLNVPFNAGSLFSQVWYPLVLLVWVVSMFKNNRYHTVIQKLVRITTIFFLLALIYLPLMIAKENFASYRTLYVFNLAVFVMVVDGVLQMGKGAMVKKIFVIAMALVLLLSCWFTLNILYLNPLQKEYKALQTFVQTHYTPAVQNVYFIRADKHLFSAQVYRDEFGLPSTYRDWVPVPIVKQLVLQQTGDRTIAEDLNVVPFENRDAFDQSGFFLKTNDLLIDMNVLFKKRRKD